MAGRGGRSKVFHWTIYQLCFGVLWSNRCFRKSRGSSYETDWVTLGPLVCIRASRKTWEYCRMALQHSSPTVDLRSASRLKIAAHVSNPAGRCILEIHEMSTMLRRDAVLNLARGTASPRGAGTESDSCPTAFRRHFSSTERSGMYFARQTVAILDIKSPIYESTANIQTWLRNMKQMPLWSP